MITTTIPLARSQISPDSLKSRGFGNEAPSPVGETRISIVSVAISIRITLLFQYLWAFAASKLLGTSVIFTATVNALKSGNTETLFTAPPLVFVLNGKSTDDKDAKIANLGFSKQSSGRYKFFKGPASDEVVPKLLTFGASPDAYAPYGATNITGYVALGMLSRLLHAVLGFISHFNDLTDLDLDKVASVNADLWKKFAVTSASDITSAGILFPYFEGMVLPDKAFTPRTIIAMFGPCLGKTAAEIKRAVKTIQDGWPSLSTTPAGLEISHLVFGMELAQKGKVNLRPIYINGFYRGFVLVGKKFVVFKGAEEILPTSAEKLREEFLFLNEHDTTIDELATIISAIPLDNEKKEMVTVSPEHLSSPRHIHYLIKVRNVNPDNVSRISALVNKLHYTQTYWEKSQDTLIARAIEAIISNNWLDASCPYYMSAGHLFSKDPIISTLAAFGPKAISLLGTGNTTNFALSKAGRMYENIQGLKLEGIPIFFKPLTLAAQDFRDLLSKGVITFKAGAKDKKGYNKVAGLGTYVGFESPQYPLVSASLVEAHQSMGKRKRGTEDADGMKGAPSAKKIKETKEVDSGLLDLFVLPGVPARESDDEEDDVAMDDGFFD